MEASSGKKNEIGKGFLLDVSRLFCTFLSFRCVPPFGTKKQFFQYQRIFHLQQRENSIKLDKVLRHLEPGGGLGTVSVYHVQQ